MNVVKLSPCHGDKVMKWGPTIMMCILPLVIVAILVQSAPDINKQQHGFNRHFVSPGPELIRVVPVTKRCKYIAGVTDNNIYFSGMQSGQLEHLDIGTGKISSIHLVKDPILQQHLSSSCLAKVIDSCIHLFDVSTGLMIKGSISNDKIDVYKLPELYTKFVSLNQDQVFIRKFISRAKDQAFYKYDFNTDDLSDSVKITSPGTDGGLSTDGDLVYDPGTTCLAYVEYNSNRITIFDTAGHVCAATHSIDTFSTNLFLTNTDASGSVTNAAPVQFVNQSAAFDQGILYVQSGIKSDNQRLRDFNKQVVIDRYVNNAVKYEGSFCIKGVKEGLRNWIVKDQQLYLLSNNSIYIYSLKDMHI